ncbi:MAG: alpha/beta hydrolase family protein [Steroidobacteraceae bacterium]
MSNTRIAVLALVCVWAACRAQNAKPFDPYSAFGARPSASGLHLSPDGKSVVYVAPAEGQGSVALTFSLAKGTLAKTALNADGKPFRLEDCHWVSNDRIVCSVYAVTSSPIYGSARMTRIVAVDAGGKNLKVLSTRENYYTRGFQLGGGHVIDWLPDENGAVLMTRVYMPDDHTASHIGSSTEGLGVDWIDTRTLVAKHVEPARLDAFTYITDGRGAVRIVGTRNTHINGQQDTGILSYWYRLPGSRDWQKLGDYNEIDRTGFAPRAVDHDLNVAYGYKKKDGRVALYSVALDGSRHEEVVYERPDVDVSRLIQIGRRNRVVGAGYSTDVSAANYFAPDLRALVQSLAKALPQSLVDIVDSSVDESRLLVFTSSDVDPGVYYLFDRTSHQLQTFLVRRAELEGVKLARVKPITYPAADGTPIPAYLTLPPGREDAKGLPAIVLPHGGPSDRDDWGFNWLPQFFAARGFAVLQPNFRGSAGYGDTWFQQNGFKSWQLAVGDVLDGGRWLVHEGIADASKLAVVGWSYGGYAALQSGVADSTVFKAIVAIAPVTDLAALKEEHRHWSDFELVSGFVGEGPHVQDGSPIEHTDRIKVPVLLFHGGHDSNVSIEQSTRMAARLKATGGKCELVTWEDLDHQLDDSAARSQMLRKSDEFLRQALGTGAP